MSIYEFGALLTNHGQDALVELWKIGRGDDPRARVSDRIVALNSVLDRTIGKAVDTQVILDVRRAAEVQQANLPPEAAGALESILRRLTPAIEARVLPSGGAPEGEATQVPALPEDSESGEG